MTTPCIVCGVEIAKGAEVYSNLWEKSLKKHPCCSKACAGKFHVDVHWMPPEPPGLLEDERVIERWTEGAYASLHRGQIPGAVTRELLLAGLAPSQVRGILQRVLSDLENPPVDARMRSNRNLTIWTTIFGAIVGLFSGWFFVAGVTGGRPTSSNADAEAVRDAERVVDAWERQFEKPSGRAIGGK